MIVYSSFITHRLGYICDFVGKELTGNPFQVTDKKVEFLGSTGPRINYSFGCNRILCCLRKKSNNRLLIVLK
jgi:hypothetical protein